MFEIEKFPIEALLHNGEARYTYTDEDKQDTLCSLFLNYVPIKKRSVTTSHLVIKVDVPDSKALSDEISAVTQQLNSLNEESARLQKQLAETSLDQSQIQEMVIEISSIQGQIATAKNNGQAAIEKRKESRNKVLADIHAKLKRIFVETRARAKAGKEDNGKCGFLQIVKIGEMPPSPVNEELPATPSKLMQMVASPIKKHRDAAAKAELKAGLAAIKKAALEAEDHYRLIDVDLKDTEYTDSFWLTLCSFEFTSDSSAQINFRNYFNIQCDPDHSDSLTITFPKSGSSFAKQLCQALVVDLQHRGHPSAERHYMADLNKNTIHINREKVKDLVERKTRSAALPLFPVGEQKREVSPPPTTPIFPFDAVKKRALQFVGIASENEEKDEKKVGEEQPTWLFDLMEGQEQKRILAMSKLDEEGRSQNFSVAVVYEKDCDDNGYYIRPKEYHLPLSMMRTDRWGRSTPLIVTAIFERKEDSSDFNFRFDKSFVPGEEQIENDMREGALAQQGPILQRAMQALKDELPKYLNDEKLKLQRIAQELKNEVAEISLAPAKLQDELKQDRELARDAKRRTEQAVAAENQAKAEVRRLESAVHDAEEKIADSETAEAKAVALKQIEAKRADVDRAQAVLVQLHNEKSACEFRDPILWIPCSLLERAEAKRREIPSWLPELLTKESHRVKLSVVPSRVEKFVVEAARAVLDKEIKTEPTAGMAVFKQGRTSQGVTRVTDKFLISVTLETNGILSSSSEYSALKAQAVQILKDELQCYFDLITANPRAMADALADEVTALQNMPNTLREELRLAREAVRNAQAALARAQVAVSDAQENEVVVNREVESREAAVELATERASSEDYINRMQRQADRARARANKFIPTVDDRFKFTEDTLRIPTSLFIDEFHELPAAPVVPDQIQKDKWQLFIEEVTKRPQEIVEQLIQNPNYNANGCLSKKKTHAKREGKKTQRMEIEFPVVDTALQMQLALVVINAFPPHQRRRLNLVSEKNGKVTVHVYEKDKWDLFLEKISQTPGEIVDRLLDEHVYDADGCLNKKKQPVTRRGRNLYGVDLEFPGADVDLQMQLAQALINAFPIEQRPHLKINVAKNGKVILSISEQCVDEMRANAVLAAYHGLLARAHQDSAIEIKEEAREAKRPTLKLQPIAIEMPTISRRSVASLDEEKRPPSPKHDPEKIIVTISTDDEKPEPVTGIFVVSQDQEGNVSVHVDSTSGKKTKTKDVSLIFDTEGRTIDLQQAQERKEEKETENLLSHNPKEELHTLLTGMLPKPRMKKTKKVQQAKTQQETQEDQDKQDLTEIVANPMGVLSDVINDEPSEVTRYFRKMTPSLVSSKEAWVDIELTHPRVKMQLKMAIVLIGALQKHKIKKGFYEVIKQSKGTILLRLRQDLIKPCLLPPKPKALSNEDVIKQLKKITKTKYAHADERAAARKVLLKEISTDRLNQIWDEIKTSPEFTCCFSASFWYSSTQKNVMKLVREEVVERAHAEIQERRNELTGQLRRAKEDLSGKEDDRYQARRSVIYTQKVKEIGSILSKYDRLSSLNEERDNFRRLGQSLGFFKSHRPATLNKLFDSNEVCLKKR